MDMSERIKQRRTELGYTQEELANRLGLQKSAIAKYESGRVENIKRTVILKMADVLECSPSYLMGWESTSPLPPLKNISPITKQKFPLFDGIAAGKPRYIPDGVELYIEASTKIKADFVLKVHGDSMIGARIHDGDYVFIRIQPEVENGEIAAVRIGDSATLKRVYYYQAQQMLVLRAENPAYKDMEFYGQELEDVQILGKAIAFQSDVK